MASGLLLLLDDVAAIAKSALVTVDDIAAQALKAGTKAAGVVIDDAAVTPRYVVGISPARELPMIWKITVGSLRNKAVIMLAVLALQYLAPWAMTPLLMVGGFYLCYEGFEKVAELFVKHPHGHEAALEDVTAETPQALEDAKVKGAIRTDFILSAEIMAITLAAVPGISLFEQAVVLIAVGIGITFGVYGVVGLIVKADDVGLALVANRFGSRVLKAVGRGLVVGMPMFLSALAAVGTAAMLWVGGSIIVHGLDIHGVAAPEHFIEHLAELAVHSVPFAPGFVAWAATTAMQAVVGIVAGGLATPVIARVLSPAYRFAVSLPRRLRK
jgi:predicted DNA repair protein MutK